MQRRVQVIRGMALAVALCFSLTLTACVGPTVVTGSDQAGPFNVRIKIDPPTMQAGQKATLNYFFTDPKNADAPVTNLALVHERVLHVFVVDRQLAYFKHDHVAGVSASNSYPANVQFGHEGTYRVFAEFAPTVQVTDPVTNKKVPKAGDTVIYSSTISFGTGGGVQDEPAPLNEDLSPKNAGGITIALSTTNTLRVGQPVTFTFNLSERGEPIHTLASYLGEAGHLIILDGEAQHLAHVHALESMGAMGNEGAGSSLSGASGAQSGNPSQLSTPAPNGSPVAGMETPTASMAMGAETATPGVVPTGTPNAFNDTLGFRPLPTVPPSTSLGGGTYGPNITFQYQFDEPGLYKLWGQFLYRGQVLTGDFVVTVAP